MADEIDAAQARTEETTDRAIAAARAAAEQIPAGTAGDCERCGEPSGRLVGGACADCRDRYRLP